MPKQHHKRNKKVKGGDRKTQTVGKSLPVAELLKSDDSTVENEICKKYLENPKEFINQLNLINGKYYRNFAAELLYSLFVYSDDMQHAICMAAIVLFGSIKPTLCSLDSEADHDCLNHNFMENNIIDLYKFRLLLDNIGCFVYCAQCGLVAKLKEKVIYSFVITNQDRINVVGDDNMFVNSKQTKYITIYINKFQQFQKCEIDFTMRTKHDNTFNNGKIVKNCKTYEEYHRYTLLITNIGHEWIYKHNDVNVVDIYSMLFPIMIGPIFVTTNMKKTNAYVFGKNETIRNMFYYYIRKIKEVNSFADYKSCLVNTIPSMNNGEVESILSTLSKKDDVIYSKYQYMIISRFILNLTKTFVETVTIDDTLKDNFGKYFAILHLQFNIFRMKYIDLEKEAVLSTNKTDDVTLTENMKSESLSVITDSSNDTLDTVNSGVDNCSEVFVDEMLDEKKSDIYVDMFYRGENHYKQISLDIGGVNRKYLTTQFVFKDPVYDINEFSVDRHDCHDVFSDNGVYNLDLFDLIFDLKICAIRCVDCFVARQMIPNVVYKFERYVDAKCSEVSLDDEDAINCKEHLEITVQLTSFLRNRMCEVSFMVKSTMYSDYDTDDKKIISLDYYEDYLQIDSNGSQWLNGKQFDLNYIWHGPFADDMIVI